MHRRGGKVTLMNPSACGSPSLSEKKKAQKQDSDRIAFPAYHDLYQQLLRDEHSPTLTPENVADRLESFRATFESKDTRELGLPIPLVLLLRRILLRFESMHGVTPAHQLASVLVLEVKPKMIIFAFSQLPPPPS